MKKIRSILLLLLFLGSSFSCQSDGDGTTESQPDQSIPDEDLIQLPQGAEEAIARALSEPVPQGMIPGETGYVESQGFQIWYNSINPGEGKETVLILSGFGAPAFHVPGWLLIALVEEDYHILRFDARDTGFSSWDEDWSFDTAYSVIDMAGDAMAVMDANQVEQAHIIGFSFGGMYAQTIALQYPERIKSVIPIFASGFLVNPDLPPEDLLGPFIEKCDAQFSDEGDPADALRKSIAIYEFMRGGDPRPFPEEDMYDIARGSLFQAENIPESNPHVLNNVGVAEWLCGSRLEALKDTTIPFLAIHAKNDPIMPFEHGLLYSDAIPNCETLWFDHMGHFITTHDSQAILEASLSFLARNS